MAYGVNLRVTFREAGVMTAKVLRGTKTGRPSNRFADQI